MEARYLSQLVQYANRTMKYNTMASCHAAGIWSNYLSSTFGQNRSLLDYFGMSQTKLSPKCGK